MNRPSLSVRLLATLALFCAGLTAATVRAEDPAATRFQTLLAGYYEDYLALFPVEAAVNGDNDPRYEAAWPNDIGPEHRAQVAALCDRYLGELAQFDRAALSETDQLSYDLLQWNLTLRRDGTRQLFYLTPVNQFSSATLTFAQLGSGASVHPFRTAADYRNFLRRAQGFSTWVDTAIANLREGATRGIVLPRVLVERMLPQLAPLMADDPEKNLFFAPLARLPAGLSPEERVRLTVEYADGLRATVLPAYRRLHAYLQDEYLAQARTTAGLCALPGGREAYAYAIRLQTGTDLAPEAIHELGLREVARIRREMEQVQAQVGYKGTLADFLRYVATDPRFAPFHTEEEVLAGYRAIAGRVLARIPELFNHTPRARFEIRATERFRAESASAEYNAGTADGTRPGVFYVPIPNPAKMRTTRMEDLFLHEAIPGHHFQISLALENTSLPRFRRYDANNAFVEGWALYCESLGPELGLYTDPYQRLGMLLGDMHRAVRLVVDTGLHALGWSREQALRYGAEQEGGGPERQAVEIDRYLACPGQALGYKLGQLKIRELRTLAEQRLGARFDVRAFHDAVLSEGSLTLAIFETHLRAWIDRQAAP